MSSYAPWLADFQLLAAALLLGVMLAIAALRQPAQRLAVAKSTLAALAALAILCALPGWSLVHLLNEPPAVSDTTASSIADPSPITQTTTPFTPPLDAEASSTAIPIPPFAAPSQPTPLSADPIDWISATVMAYAAGSAAVAFWLITGALLAHRVRREATLAPPELQEILRQLCAPEKPTPQLLISPRITAPVALGLRHPTILLPAATFPIQHSPFPISSSQLLPILAHELAHIEHRDLHTLAATRLLFILLWPQPLFWLLRRTIRLDQETLADAAAADRAGRLDYAQQLLAWARTAGTQRPPRLAGAVGLWEGPSQLKRRIAVLLNEQFNVMRSCSQRWRRGTVASLAILALGLSSLTLQPADSAAEQASESAAAEKAAETPRAPGATIHRALGMATIQAIPLTPAKDRPNALELHIVDENKQPLADVEATLYKASFLSGEAELLRSQASNGEGNAQFADVVPADQVAKFDAMKVKGEFTGGSVDAYLVALRRPGYATAMILQSSGDLALYGAKRSVMLRPAAKLSGRVTDAAGKPVPDVSVAAGPFAGTLRIDGVNAVRTDEDGRYAFADLAAFDREAAEEKNKNNRSSFNFVTTADETANEPREPEDPTAADASSLLATHPDFAVTAARGGNVPGETNFQMGPAASIVGRVVHYETGKPVVGARVNAWLKPAETEPITAEDGTVSWPTAQSHNATTTTDDQGNYRLSNLIAGPYDIWAESAFELDDAKWVSRGLREVPVAAGQAPNQVQDLVVGPPPTIEFQLVDANSAKPLQLDGGGIAQTYIMLVGGPNMQGASVLRRAVSPEGKFSARTINGKSRVSVFVHDRNDPQKVTFMSNDDSHSSGELFDLDFGQTVSARLPVFPMAAMDKMREGRMEGLRLNNEKKHREAIEAYSKVLSRFPADNESLTGRAHAYRYLGDYRAAIADFEQAQARYHDSMSGYWLADLLASSPVDGTRDGERALKFAQAMFGEIDDSSDAEYMSRLWAMVAAAHAELGDFPQALAAQEKAVELAPESRKADMQNRLKLYQANKPFRREAPTTPASDVPAKKSADQGAAKSPPLAPLVFKAVEPPPASPTTGSRAVAMPNPTAGLTQLDALDLKFPSDATWHLVPQTKINLNAAATLGGAVK